MSEGGNEGIHLGIPGIDNVVEIGRSASHTTYRVRDIASGRTVVIKLLNAGRDWPGLADRFEREQTAMAALGHPNIVPVLGHGWSETGMPYIVTAEVAGGSIGDRLRGPTPMTGPDILSLGVRLAGALESAHRSGVVHGDLRPDDMMLSLQGEPLLADFGVVTLVRPNAADVTDPAELAHVAPELLDGQPATPGSDLYSLASALYTLFAGLPAYVRPGEQSIIPVIKRIASDPLPDLAAKSVPAPVVDAISKGMAKDPADRHQTAQDLGRSLQQAQVALGLPMTEMTMLGAPSARTAPVRTAPMQAAAPTAPAPVAAAPPVAPASSLPAGSSGAPPNRTPLIVGVVAGVLILAIIGFFATRDNGSKASSASGITTTTRRDTTTTTATTTPTTTADTELIKNVGGQLAVTVPKAWSQRNPANTKDGFPELLASPNLTEFLSTTFQQPGVDFAALPSSSVDASDLDAALDKILAISRGSGSTLQSLCTRGTREDLTPAGPGLTVGRSERLTSCGGGGDVIIIAAANADQAFTALLEIHVGNPPDDAGVDSVTTSFDVIKFP
jgi:serine/threonine protein kinase